MAVRALRPFRRPVSTIEQRGGVGLCAPLGAERIRHFAEDYRRPQGPLAFVVGRLDVAALQEPNSLLLQSPYTASRSLRLSTSVGLRASNRSSRISKRRRRAAMVASARSGRRRPTAHASLRNDLKSGAKIVSP
jgi:hypothetical protein